MSAESQRYASTDASPTCTSFVKPAGIRICRLSLHDDSAVSTEPCDLDARALCPDGALGPDPALASLHAKLRRVRRAALRASRRSLPRRHALLRRASAARQAALRGRGKAVRHFGDDAAGGRAGGRTARAAGVSRRVVRSAGLYVMPPTRRRASRRGACRFRHSVRERAVGRRPVQLSRKLHHLVRVERDRSVSRDACHRRRAALGVARRECTDGRMRNQREVDRCIGARNHSRDVAARRTRQQGAHHALRRRGASPRRDSSRRLCVGVCRALPSAAANRRGPSDDVGPIPGDADRKPVIQSRRSHVAVREARRCTPGHRTRELFARRRHARGVVAVVYVANHEASDRPLG